MSNPMDDVDEQGDEQEESNKLFSNIMPSQEDIRQRGNEWQAIIDKYSIIQSEADGLDLDDIVAEMEAEHEDGESDHDNSSEASDDMEDNDNENAYENCLMSYKCDSTSQTQPLTFGFSKEFIEKLKQTFRQKVSECGTMNLPFWYEENESSRTVENFTHDYMHTPKITLGSKKFQRSTEVQRSISMANIQNSLPTLTFNKFNGQNSLADFPLGNMDQLPPSIQQLINSKVSFTLKVREREYDVQINVDSHSSNNLLHLTETPQSNKREGPKHKIRAIPVKRIRKRASIAPVSSDSEDDRPKVAPKLPNIKLNTTAKIPLLTKAENVSKVAQTISEINLNDISCGSSCSTVTSDDEKNYNPQKYFMLRQEKKLKHKQAKLLERAAVDINLTSNDNPVKNKKFLGILDEISCGSSCSTVTSDDEKNFALLKYSKLREEKKMKHKQTKLVNRTKENDTNITNKTVVTHKNNPPERTLQKNLTNKVAKKTTSGRMKKA